MRKPMTSKKKRNNAIMEALIHWDTMIEWVEKQPRRDKIDWDKMEAEIQQSWYAPSCSICELCNHNCMKCILHKKYGRCGNWIQIDRAKTWGGWLIHAKPFRNMIACLYED